MANNWTLEKLNSLITDGVEESLHLEYKAADALSKTDGKKIEMSKDVSAFANSDGGVIIYGIAEHQTGPKHLPEKLDPIDRKFFAKESLEQIINSRISPRIYGIVITPISINPGNLDNVVYVVEIPKGTTAHQASDKRYYRRFNFESIAMEDWEIKDIINRQTRSMIEIQLMPMFKAEYIPMYLETRKVPMKFSICATNNGTKVIKYLDVMIAGDEISSETLVPKPTLVDGLFELYYTNERNLTAKIKDSEFIINIIREPILPDTFLRIGEIEILSDYFVDDLFLHITASMDDNKFSKKVRGKELLDLIRA